MKIQLHRKSSAKLKARLKSKARVRHKVSGSSERPRLNVFRSAKHIYAQIIDDTNGKTLVSCSTVSYDVKGGTGNRDAAKNVGMEVAKLAIAKNIKSVVFDRSGYVYHGRVKALADGAREAGLNF